MSLRLTERTTLETAIAHLFDKGIDVTKINTYEDVVSDLNMVLDQYEEYEAKMDELLCYLTHGKWSKSRSYDLDILKSLIDEEYEIAYSENCKDCTQHDN